MFWAIFLHFYQPPNQKLEILQDVVSQSYRPVLAILKKNPKAKVTVNLDGCLTDQLMKSGFEDVVADLRELIKKNQVELVLSAKYHALLPLIPKSEIIRLINEGFLTNNKIFGDDWKPVGFFPTELAIGTIVIDAVKILNLSYLLADEISLTGKLGDLRQRQLFQESGVNIFFVNRKISEELRANRNLTFQGLKDQILAKNGKSHLISANDVELFGHHYPGREEILENIIASQGKDWQLVTLSELLSKIKKIQKIKVREGSWETSPDDLINGLPFPLWFDPANPIQNLYRRLAYLVTEYLNKTSSKSTDDPGWVWHSARNHLNYGLASCYLFWASCRPWWNPDMIIDGATELVKVARALHEVSGVEKKKAEDLYVRIIKTAWDWHWSGEAQRRIDEFEKTERKVCEVKLV